ncbi:MAG: glycerol-3-phosphate 1-O-acyltransferase PlsY [Lachnospiraceae bacterium]|nr:glycerol-3-phosphate 1-O-acyltransferase PlsY [Lachnospiraceae bacterium]
MAVWIIICMIIGYFFGTFPTGLLIGKAMDVDIRKSGSGNIGSTNALRVLGAKPGAMTLIGDMIKCALAFLLCYLCFKNHFIDAYGDTKFMALTVGLGATLGHNFPFFLKFKGGKGVACLAATALLFDWRLFILGIVTFTVITLTTKYVSVASMCCGIGFSIWVVVCTTEPKVLSYIFTLCFLSLNILRHIPNIKRLINHNENKVSIGKKKKQSAE